MHLSDGTLHGNGEDPDDGKNYVDDEALLRVATMHVRELEQPNMEATKITMTSKLR